jgi:hypothetical protein
MENKGVEGDEAKVKFLGGYLGYEYKDIFPAASFSAFDTAEKDYLLS